MRSRSPKQKVLGFILHFGYVESNRVGVVFLRHMNGYFTSVKAGLNHLANYFLEDYMESAGDFKSLSGFQAYLYEVPTMVASGPPEPSFCPNHWNVEQWWPWDSVSELYKYLPYFWENTEGAESLLCHHVSPHLLTANDADEFKLELLEFQRRPENGDEFSVKAWERDSSEAVWSPVVRKQRRKRRNK